jgi:DNA-binding NarL/FixJ family response regulator
VIGVDETRVVIVDRRDFDRLALDVLCQQTAGVTVSASVASVAEAARVLRAGGAIVLIGRQLLRVDGPAAVSQLRAAGAERVVVVGTSNRGRLSAEAVRVDADGVLERDGDGAAQAYALRGERGAVPRWAGDRGSSSRTAAAHRPRQAPH